MTDSIKLYAAKVCPFAQRSVITTLAKGIDHEYVEIDLQNKPEWFHEVSPYGKVPALSHNGKPVYESGIVNEYLDEIFPNPPLMADDAYTKAQMRIWMAYCNDVFIGRFYSLLRSQDKAEQAELKQSLLDCLHFIENEGLAKCSGNGPFWFGEKLSLVDITFYPFFERFAVLTHYRDINIPDTCPRIKQWFDIMQSQDCVKSTINPIEFYVEQYARYAKN